MGIFSCIKYNVCIEDSLQVCEISLETTKNNLIPRTYQDQFLSLLSKIDYKMVFTIHNSK